VRSVHAVRERRLKKKKKKSAEQVHHLDVACNAVMMSGMHLRKHARCASRTAIVDRYCCHAHRSVASALQVSVVANAWLAYLSFFLFCFAAIEKKKKRGETGGREEYISATPGVVLHRL
jgi:hypothetical protein